MKKKSRNIASIATFAFFIMLAFGSEESLTKEGRNNNNEKNECLNDSYASGYEAGKLTLIMQSTGTCEDYVNSYNYNTGRNVLKADKCYCEGFNDGSIGSEKKYSSKETESEPTEVSKDNASAIVDKYIKYENEKLNSNSYKANVPVEIDNAKGDSVEGFESEENQHGE